MKGTAPESEEPSTTWLIPPCAFLKSLRDPDRDSQLKLSEKSFLAAQCLH